VSEPRDLEVERHVREQLRRLPCALVALSGGVDSSVVAALAVAELGDRVLAVTGASASLDPSELAAIGDLCKRLGLRHETVQTQELNDPRYVANAPNRCYFCKGELYGTLARLAQEHHLAAVLDGTTAEDLAGHRPGKRAADEHAVVSPLVDARATKADVRAIARRLGLSNAERPSSPCLSSRIAYGITVTPDRLSRVGRAEQALRTLGFAEVRVRLHDTIARIEVPKHDLARALEHAATITRELKALGFVYVTLDLVGLRSGSLLEAVSERVP
jgi:pyridinium-3,5-biscarboxylic acid mononucleotide sulfurtransferase